MKYMNAKKKYTLMNLQLFAGDDGGDDGDGSGEDGDDQDDDDSDKDGDDQDERRFTQKDIDDAVNKRLARERRKWQREKNTSKKDGDKDDKKDDGESEDSKARKAAEERASKAEAKNACYEAGVSKDSVDDVVALARSYMAADEDMDLEEAIEKVVKKYPQFKQSTADSDDDEDDNKNKSWGQRQKGNSKKTKSIEDEIMDALYK